MIGELAVHRIASCDPPRFARLGQALLARVAGDRTPRLLLAALDGDFVLLGRFQRARSSVDLDKAGKLSLTVARRLGGGRALRAGQGTLGLLLSLPEPASLLPRPIGPDKILNRYVRGLLGGLTAAGAAGGAHYFGRDFVSADKRQIGSLSQDGSAGGAVLFEAFVAVTRPIELPAGVARFRPHSDPRSSGPGHACLAEIAARPVAMDELMQRIAAGYARIHSCAIAWQEAPLAEGADPEPPVDEPESDFTASGPHEVPIGFVEALVRTGGDRLLAARVRGDFIAPAFAVRALEAALAGCPLDAREIGLRVDAAFRTPPATILGLTSRKPLADAILDAGLRSARGRSRPAS